MKMSDLGYDFYFKNDVIFDKLSASTTKKVNFADVSLEDVGSDLIVGTPIVLRSKLKREAGQLFMVLSSLLSSS